MAEEARVAGTLEVERNEPEATARGKIFAVAHLKPYIVRWPDRFGWRIDLGRAPIAAAPD